MSNNINEKMDQLLTGFGEFKISMEKRMDNLENRFDQMESRFDKLESRVDKMETNFNKRFDSIEQDIQNIYNKLLEHDKRFENLESRIGSIFKLSAQNRIDLEDLKDKIKDKPDYFEERISEL